MNASTPLTNGLDVMPGDPYHYLTPADGKQPLTAVVPGVVFYVEAGEAINDLKSLPDGQGRLWYAVVFLGLNTPRTPRGRAVLMLYDPVARTLVPGVSYTLVPLPGTYGEAVTLTPLGADLHVALGQHASSGPAPHPETLVDATIPNLLTPSGGGGARPLPEPVGQKFVNCRPGDTWYPWLQTAGQIGLISGHNDGTVDLALGPFAKLVINGMRWAAGQAPL